MAYQLRLRNIGGIIIVDFIDMSLETNRQKVLAALEQALGRDKAKSTIIGIGELGLLQMTRKRVRESLGETLTHTCANCKGRGLIKSEETVANEILRAINRTLAAKPATTLLVNMNPHVADCLYDIEDGQIEGMEKEFSANIVPVARSGFHAERYEIVTDLPES